MQYCLYKNNILGLLFLICLAHPTYAKNTTLEDQIINQPNEKRDGSYFSFNIENDALGSGKDENYTSGVRFSYHDAQLDIPSFIQRIGMLYPGFRINETTALTYSIGQNLYTPRDITLKIPNPKDHPRLVRSHKNSYIIKLLRMPMIQKAGIASLKTSQALSYHGVANILT
jgi:hypothetical protein